MVYSSPGPGLKRDDPLINAVYGEIQKKAPPAGIEPATR